MKPSHSETGARTVTQPSSPAATDKLAAEPVPPRRSWQSQELFGGALEVEIQHNQAVYRLRQTSLGKLILTK